MLIINGISSPLAKYLAENFCEDGKRSIIGVTRRNNFSLQNCTVLKEDSINEIQKISGAYGSILVNVSSAVPSNTSNDHDFFHANCLSIPDVLERIILKFKPKVIVNISTSDVYDHDLITATESKTGTPSTTDGLSKLILEKRIIDLGRVHDLKVCNLRVPVLIAPGVKNNFIVKWIQNYSFGSKLYYSNPNGLFNNLGDARTILSVIKYVDEMIDVPQFLNICSQDTVTIERLLSSFCTLTRSDISIFEERKLSKRSQPMNSSILDEMPVDRFTVNETLHWMLESGSN